MKLHFKRRSGKFIGSLDVPSTATTEEFKALFYKEYHYYPERQRWIVEPSNVVLKDGALSDFGAKDGTHLVFKDLGVQISWRLVFVTEYFGPILIFPLFYFFPEWIYGWAYNNSPYSSSWMDVNLSKPRGLVQTVALFLILFHYIKRELETLFIHRFSNGTMPLIRVPINCGHYWVLCGVMVSYFLYHPLYTSPWDEKTQRPIVYFLAALMLVFEILNFQTHLTLRGLRARGTKERGIPNGWGFGSVSCANYTWETLAWVTFCILTNTLTAYFFTLIAFLQMTQWALKKHAMYRRDFKDYPRCRKAIIPWLL